MTDNRARQRGEGVMHPRLPSPAEIMPGLARRLGYQDTRSIPQDLNGYIQKALEESLEAARPQAVCRMSRIERIGRKEILGTGFKLESPKWARFSQLLDSPEILLVYALTLGDDLDKRIDALRDAPITLSYVLDAAGSEIVERTADRMEADLWERPAFKGLQRTIRFSPGFCDWRLNAQQEIFQFLHPESIGMLCTKAWSMLPSKSITAALLGARGLPFHTPCPLCTQKACPHKRVE